MADVEHKEPTLNQHIKTTLGRWLKDGMVVL